MSDWERLYRELQAQAEKVLYDDRRLHDVWCQPHEELSKMLGPDATGRIKAAV